MQIRFPLRSAATMASSAPKRTARSRMALCIGCMLASGTEVRGYTPGKRFPAGLAADSTFNSMIREQRHVFADTVMAEDVNKLGSDQTIQSDRPGHAKQAVGFASMIYRVSTLCMRSEWEERPMKDINRAGPTEEREAQLSELVAKLRKSGRLGESAGLGSETAAENMMAGSGAWDSSVSPPAPPFPPSPTSPTEESPTEADLAASSEGDKDMPISSLAVTVDSVKQSGASAEPPKRTSSVGGRWEPPVNSSAVDVHRPKVSTWGVFERPADISRTFGGGKRVGIGGYQPDEEERKKKDEEIKARLTAYRRSIGADVDLEREHADEIKEAQIEARQLFRFGQVRASIETLEKIKPYACFTTPLGGSVLLELGIAYDAADRSDEAAQMFIKCARAHHGVADSHTVKEEDAAIEFTKIGRLRAPTDVKRYSTTDAWLTSAGRKPARMLLRSAAVKRADGGAPQRLRQAVTFLQQTPLPTRVPHADAAAVAAALEGEWLLGFTVSARGAIAIAPAEAQQAFRAAEASFERVMPAAVPGLLRSGGAFSAKVDAATSTATLSLSPQRTSLGPLPLPATPYTERLLYLDSLMCITQPGADSADAAIWVRPTMKISNELGDDGFEP